MFQYNFHLLSHSGEVMISSYRQPCDSYVDAVRKGTQWFMDQHDLNINYKSLRVEESNTHEDAFFGTILPYNITTDRPSILALCEANEIVLRPDRLYKFTVVPGCEKCKAIADSYAVKETEK